MKQTVLLVFSPSSANSHALIAGVSAYARQRKWRIPLLDRADRSSLSAAIEFFRPAGCLIGGHIDRTYAPVSLPPRYAKSIPVVYLDRDPFPPGRQIFCVAHDSVETGRMAAKELFDLGLASYAYVAWHKPTFWSVMRRKGFEQELKEHGIRAAVFSPDGGTNLAHLRLLGGWLKQLSRPVGIFAANDRMAADVLLVAERIGLRAPSDLVVIGVDNNPAICTSSNPSITSIAPDFERGGYLAAKLLDERLANPAMAPTTQWFRPMFIQRRESTARTASGHPFVERALSLISEKACEGLRAKDVADSMPGSRRYAEREFLAVTGKTILQAIVDVRLDQAKALLQNPNCYISSIASRCGWSSSAYLRRTFRARIGMTMSEWRKRNCG